MITYTIYSNLYPDLDHGMVMKNCFNWQGSQIYHQCKLYRNGRDYRRNWEMNIAQNEKNQKEDTSESNVCSVQNMMDNE